MNKFFPQMTLLLVLLLLVGSVLASQERYALIIGNGSYGDAVGALKNPANDAQAMAASLEKKGFEVTHLNNASKREMEDAIREFSRNLRLNAVGLFFFAGHAIEVDGENYLIPIGANIENEIDAKYEAVSVGRLLDGMDRAGNGLNLVVLDACRNNPYSRRFRSAKRGLTMMYPASGTMILYATEPGNVAADGQGKNGIFTEHLLQFIEKPGLSVEEAFKQTALAVKEDTRGKQVPWYEGIILGQFAFVPASPLALEKQSPTIPPATAPLMAVSPDSQEMVFWQSVESKPTVAGYQAYVSSYPEGVFVALAKARVNELSRDLTIKPQPQNNYPVAQPIVEKLSLTVKTVPSDARVRILNIVPKYVDGITLDPGNYRIEVTRPGYKRHVKDFLLSASNQFYPVTLEKLTPRSVAPHKPVPLKRQQPEVGLFNKPGSIKSSARIKPPTTTGLFKPGQPGQTTTTGLFNRTKPKQPAVSGLFTTQKNQPKPFVADQASVDSTKLVASPDKPLPKRMDQLGKTNQLVFLHDVTLNTKGEVIFFKGKIAANQVYLDWDCQFNGPAGQTIRRGQTLQLADDVEAYTTTVSGGFDEATVKLSFKQKDYSMSCNSAFNSGYSSLMKTSNFKTAVGKYIDLR